MLKVVLASALGGLAAGAVALVASATTRNAPESSWPSSSVQPSGMIEAFGSRAATSEPALVECEPHQRAELRRIAVNGREVVQVACVTHAHIAQPAVLPGSDIVAAPAVAARPAASAVTVRQRVAAEEPVRRTSNGRSWGKSALVIGGGAGAGAGVGGLISGKKGALIGAAIGGGSAAIYEATKRR
jgi:hypothetical protein